MWFARKMLYRSIPDFRAVLPMPGRVLGIDYGSKQIGLALSDLGRTVATPWTMLHRGRWQETAALLLQCLNSENIVGIVLGYPLSLDGTKSAMTQATEQFARNIQKISTLPILLAEERFSSVTAENALLEANMRRAERAEKRDMVAAAVMLQQVLDRGL